MTPLSQNGYHYDCPVCGKPMERRTTAGPGTNGVGVEVCERCLGIWLPASSVRKIADPRAGGTLVLAFGTGVRFILRSIERMLYTDALTGVRNRRSFDFHLAAGLRDADGRYPVSLVFVDLDGFKRLNDTEGHLSGDATLRTFGRLLAALFRPMDHVARYGGDEFAAILPGTDRRTAEAVVLRVAQAIEAARLRGILPIGASIGVATFPDDGRTAEALIAAADAAMYRAKRGQPLRGEPPRAPVTRRPPPPRFRPPDRGPGSAAPAGGENPR